MSDSGNIIPDAADPAHSGGEASLPLWHKPQVSRISIASSDGGQPRLKPMLDDTAS